MTEVVFEDYQNFARKLARSGHHWVQKAGGTADYEDVFQEVCLAFVTATQKHDPEKSSFSTYFAKAAHTQIIKFVQKNVNTSHSENVSLDESITEDGGTMLDILPADTMCPDQAVQVSHRKARFLDKLAPLPRKVVEELIEPSPIVLTQFNAVKAKSELGKKKGRSFTKDPQLNIAFIMKVMGLRPSRRAFVHREINNAIERTTNE
jgi:RNA polymerase sigma factor (sigma-70 family)